MDGKSTKSADQEQECSIRSEPTAGAPASDMVKKPRIDWADPNVAAGNAPPRPRWPVAVAGAFWLIWVVFLVAIMISMGHDS